MASPQWRAKNTLKGIDLERVDFVASEAVISVVSPMLVVLFRGAWATAMVAGGDRDAGKTAIEAWMNSSVAAARLGDPARANILTALMDGRALAVSELAEAAGVTLQTASTWPSSTEANLLVAEKQGRRPLSAGVGQ
jgi:hypothetical protein